MQFNFNLFGRRAKSSSPAPQQSTQVSPIKSYDQLIKTLAIGDHGTAKSTVLDAFFNDAYNPRTVPMTIGVEFAVRTVVQNGQRIKIQHWDTSGQEHFRTILNSYFRGAKYVILFASLADPSTWERLKSYQEKARTYSNATILVAATYMQKIWGKPPPLMSHEHVMAWSSTLACPIFYCLPELRRSGVEDFFQAIAAIGAAQLNAAHQPLPDTQAILLEYMKQNHLRFSHLSDIQKSLNSDRTALSATKTVDLAPYFPPPPKQIITPFQNTTSAEQPARITASDSSRNVDDIPITTPQTTSTQTSIISSPAVLKASAPITTSSQLAPDGSLHAFVIAGDGLSIARGLINKMYKAQDILAPLRDKARTDLLRIHPDPAMYHCITTGQTPLELAALFSHWKLLRWLVSKLSTATDQNVGEKDWERLPEIYSKLLLMAAMQNQSETVLCLLEAGADPNKKRVFSGEFDGFGVLHFCVYYQKSDLIKSLIEKGADLCVRDRANRTPLDLAIFLARTRDAAYWNLVSTLTPKKMLLDTDSSQEIGPMYSQALLIACICNQSAVAIHLLSVGVKPNALVALTHPFAGYTELHFAFHHGNKALALHLLAAGADSDRAAKDESSFRSLVGEQEAALYFLEIGSLQERREAINIFLKERGELLIHNALVPSEPSGFLLSGMSSIRTMLFRFFSRSSDSATAQTLQINQQMTVENSDLIASLQSQVHVLQSQLNALSHPPPKTSGRPLTKPSLFHKREMEQAKQREARLERDKTLAAQASDLAQKANKTHKIT